MNDQRVTRLADAVHRLSTHTRANANILLRRIGRWEAEVEAYNLCMLAASHARAISALASQEPSALPSGSALARASLDAAARALWLMPDGDPYVGEERWLRFLAEDVRGRRRIAEEYPGLEGQAETAAQIEAFRVAVAQSLPPGITVAGHIPPTRSMFEEIGAPEKYGIYVLLSQTVHGTHHATAGYRRNLGTEKLLGEFFGPCDWVLPLSAAWWSLAFPLSKLAARASVALDEVLPSSIETEYVAAQREASTAGSQ